PAASRRRRSPERACSSTTRAADLKRVRSCIAAFLGIRDGMRRERASLYVLIGILVAGASVRILMMVAWQPAFMGWPDARSYLDVAHGQLFGNVLRPAGYPLFLRGLDGLGA